MAGLVYIAAFAPDKGESVAALIKNPAPGAPVPPILPPQDGYLLLDKAKFAASFAADVPKDKADFMANSQLPWGVGAWRGSHGSGVENEAELVSRRNGRHDDPAEAQRAMSKRAGATVTEVRGSHAVYVSKPEAVVALIKQAAKGVAQ